jgi:SH3-like domain-containing protein
MFEQIKSVNCKSRAMHRFLSLKCHDFSLRRSPSNALHVNIRWYHLEV